MNDTDPKIEELHIKMLMKKTGEERIKMGFSMFQFAVALVISSLRNMGISPDKMNKEIFRRIYGDDFNEQELINILNKIR